MNCKIPSLEGSFKNSELWYLKKKKKKKSTLMYAWLPSQHLHKGNFSSVCENTLVWCSLHFTGFWPEKKKKKKKAQFLGLQVEAAGSSPSEIHLGSSVIMAPRVSRKKAWRVPQLAVGGCRLSGACDTGLGAPRDPCGRCLGCLWALSASSAVWVWLPPG